MLVGAPQWYPAFIADFGSLNIVLAPAVTLTWVQTYQPDSLVWATGGSFFYFSAEFVLLLLTLASGKSSFSFPRLFNGIKPLNKETKTIKLADVWDNRIHWLDLCRQVRPITPNWWSGYHIKQQFLVCLSIITYNKKKKTHLKQDKQRTSKV